VGISRHYAYNSTPKLGCCREPKQQFIFSESSRTLSEVKLARDRNNKWSTCLKRQVSRPCSIPPSIVALILPGTPTDTLHYPTEGRKGFIREVVHILNVYVINVAVGFWTSMHSQRCIAVSIDYGYKHAQLSCYAESRWRKSLFIKTLFMSTWNTLLWADF